MGALRGVREEIKKYVGVESDEIGIELKSLILAQIERWRHA